MAWGCALLPMSKKTVKSSTKNTILFVIGWFFVVLGLLGVIMPLLPTTPFLLISLMCFSRSSPKFYDWLFNHRVVGKPLRDWQERRYIPPYVIVLGILMVSASGIFLVSRYFSN